MLHDLIVIDAFAASTRALNVESAAEIAQQQSYEEIFTSDVFKHDVFGSMTPVPGDFCNILVQINLLRAEILGRSPADSGTDARRLADMLDALHAVDIQEIAERAAASARIHAWLMGPQRLDSRPSTPHADENRRNLEAWRLFATAYRCALMHYAISSLAGFGDPSTRFRRLKAISRRDLLASQLLGKEESCYLELMDSLRALFAHNRDCRLSTTASTEIGSSMGLLHKFVIWPMAIAGIHASLVWRDEAGVQFLCSHMRELGRELGTFAVVDGAVFVEALWRTQDRDRATWRSWDSLFSKSPLFLM